MWRKEDGDLLTETIGLLDTLIDEIVDKKSTNDFNGYTRMYPRWNPLNVV